MQLNPLSISNVRDIYGKSRDNLAEDTSEPSQSSIHTLEFRLLKVDPLRLKLNGLIQTIG